MQTDKQSLKKVQKTCNLGAAPMRQLGIAPSRTIRPTLHACTNNKYILNNVSYNCFKQLMKLQVRCLYFSTDTLVLFHVRREVSIWRVKIYKGSIPKKTQPVRGEGFFGTFVFRHWQNTNWCCAYWKKAWRVKLEVFAQGRQASN